jgi:hypothetical protein
VVIQCKGLLCDFANSHQNASDYSIGELVAPAIRRLNCAGFLVVALTQDLGAGLFDDMRKKLDTELGAKNAKLDSYFAAKSLCAEPATQSKDEKSAAANAQPLLEHHVHTIYKTMNADANRSYVIVSALPGKRHADDAVQVNKLSGSDLIVAHEHLDFAAAVNMIIKTQVACTSMSHATTAKRFT